MIKIHSGDELRFERRLFFFLSCKFKPGPIISLSYHTLLLVFSSSAAAAKSLQLCPTLCSPIDGNPSGSTVPGILQARTLEWVAISFSNA